MFKIKYKLLVAGLAGFIVLLTPAVALASTPVTCPDGFDTFITNAQTYEDACGNHKTGTQQGDDAEAEQAASAAVNPTRGANFEGDCKPGAGKSLDKTNCGIIGYIVTFTNVLSALVGIVVVIMIAVGGIQYTTARDDPQAVSAAKNRIRNAILALVFYLFGFAFLQYLIPGGIF